MLEDQECASTRLKDINKKGGKRRKRKKRFGKKVEENVAKRYCRA